MASSETSGRHFSATQRVLTLFGREIHRTSVSEEEFRRILLERGNKPLAPEIECGIKQSDANNTQIAHLLISDISARRLWGEGVLTLEHFLKATETGDSVIINLSVRSQEYEVVIKRNCNFFVIVAKGEEHMDFPARSWICGYCDSTNTEGESCSCGNSPW